MNRRPVLLAAVLVMLAAGAVRADGLWDPGSRPDKRVFGDPAAEARAKDFARKMSLGDKLAIEAAELKITDISGAVRRSRSYQRRVMGAVEAYEAASGLMPEAAEPHYRAAEVLSEHWLDGPDNSPVIRDRDVAFRAIGHWEAFAERAPMDPRATQLLFRRAIVYTKLADEENFGRAIRDYETLIARSDLAAGFTDNAATWLGNLAETYMMVGRLDDALRAYERALEYSNQPLYGYGLAVALDRDEQGELARQVMRSYAEGDRMRSMTRDGIFFVPEGERHYYLGLGFEALGEPDEALKHYQLFLASGAHPRFQARARENARRVKDLARRPKKRGARPGREGTGP